MKGIHRLIACLGIPFAPVYSAVMRGREAAYRYGLFSSEKLEVPVISIGNLTMGGTGKTPMVMGLTRLLRQAGYQVAIISRGYGGKATGAVNLVSDGETILMDACSAGDEPLLLAGSLPGVPVITGSRRTLTGSYAVNELGAELVVMDDGFQHMALKRDLDLVLFKAPALLGNGRVFPAGYLREPISALARAHAFVITGVDQESMDGVGLFSEYLLDRFPEKPIFHVGQTLGIPVGIDGKEAVELSKNDHYLAFCGLADPESFRRSIIGSGYRIDMFRAFPDHHAYSGNDIEKLVRQAEGRTLLTTEKDLVKIEKTAAGLPIYALPLAIEFPAEFESFLKMSLAAISRQS